MADYVIWFLIIGITASLLVYLLPRKLDMGVDVVCDKAGARWFVSYVRSPRGDVCANIHDGKWKFVRQVRAKNIDDARQIIEEKIM